MEKQQIKAEEKPLSEWFGDMGIRRRIIVPNYQRLFSWEQENIEQLWTDISRITKDLAQQESLNPEDVKPHFLGTLLISYGDEEHGRVLADGQQRITALSLLIKASYVAWEARVSQATEVSEAEKQDRAEVQARFRSILYVRRKQFPLREAFDEGTTLLRVSPLQQNEFHRLVIPGELNKNIDSKKRTLLTKSYDYYRNQVKDLSERELALIPLGLDYLSIVQIEAVPERLQEIFETVNSLGVDLAASELAKNFITSRISGKDSDSLYEKYWRELDEEYNDMPETKSRLSSYLYYYLNASFVDITVRGSSEKPEPTTFDTTSLGTYRGYKAYLAFLETQNSKKSRSQIYGEHSEDLLFCVSMMAAARNLSRANIQVSQANTNGVRNRPQLLIALSKEGALGRRGIEGGVLWEFLPAYHLLGEERMNRRSTLFWLLRNIDMFSSPKTGPAHLKRVVDFIVAYCLRTHLGLVAGLGSAHEIRLLKALSRARQDSVASDRGFRTTGRLTPHASKVFMHSLEHFSKTQHQMTPAVDKRIQESLQQLEYKLKYDEEGNLKANTATKENRLIGYLLCALEDKLSETNRAKGNEALWRTKSDMTIEHILPQKPDPLAWPAEEGTEDEQTLSVNSLGNLTLLPGSENSRVGNAGLMYKIHHTLDLNVNKSFLELANPLGRVMLDGVERGAPSLWPGEVEWNRTRIKQRGERLANQMLFELMQV